jgi:C4-dicarboxylate transporter DctM subunit
MNSAILFGLLIALMLTGMPISIALGLTVLTFVFTMTQVPIESIALKLFTGIEKWEIMAIPFFILAGNFLTYGGVAKRMIQFAVSMIGHLHGGLALAGVVACAMFALVCGSSVATVVAIGSIVLPEMVKHGYPMRFGAGVITVAGSLGILLLPSIPKIIYAVATGTSIGAVCRGTAAGIRAQWFFFAMYQVTPVDLGHALEGVSGKHLGPDAGRHHHRRHLLGDFTATEAAAVAAVYSFFVSAFVYKAMPLRDAGKVLLQSAT